MQGSLLKSMATAAVMMCVMTACSDYVEEMVDVDTATSRDAVWRNPEVLTRAQTVQYFQREHAVGYSYNAMTGEAYSLDDIRCQVVNRAELDRLAESAPYILYTANVEQTTTMTGNVYHSFTQYVHNSNLRSDAEGGIVLIAGGAARTECSIFEDGTTDCYIVDAQSKISSGNYRIYPEAGMEMAKTHPSVLTASFQDAVRQVAAAPEKNIVACVDSFIQTYGTHVVTYAEVGGALDVLVQFDAKRYKTIENTETALSADVLAGLFKGSWEGSGSKEGYEYLEDATCRIQVLGGNVRYLDALPNMNRYRVDGVDPAARAKWQSSVVFSPDDFEQDSTTVIHMDFTPIYQFVSDPVARKRLKGYTQGAVQDLIDLLGNRNFVNVSFPYNFQTVQYVVGNKETASCTKPDVVNLVYAGRHVATVCRERVDAIDPTQDVGVVYPIYEGRIQLFNGLCQHKGRVYQVAWKGDACIVTDQGEGSNAETIYITAGVPSFTAYTNITYAPARPVPGLEIDKSFHVDGTFNFQSPRYFVKKVKGKFILPATLGNTSITGLPNWVYDASTKMMTRNENYVYIYNPNELKYYE
jgi:hypothetical protein